MNIFLYIFFYFFLFYIHHILKKRYSNISQKILWKIQSKRAVSLSNHNRPKSNTEAAAAAQLHTWPVFRWCKMLRSLVGLFDSKFAGWACSWIRVEWTTFKTFGITDDVMSFYYFFFFFLLFFSLGLVFGALFSLSAAILKKEFEKHKWYVNAQKRKRSFCY